MIARRAAFQVNSAAEMSPWLTTEPIVAKSFSDVLPPEKGVDIKAKDASGKDLWSKAKKMQDGAVQDLKAPGNSATYFYRTLTAVKAGKLQLSFGSDDGLAVWFNGQKIISKDVPRGAEADQDLAVVDLKPGKNELLIKIWNRTGGCGIYFAAGNNLSGLMTAIASKYPNEMHLFKNYFSGYPRWFQNPKETAAEQAAMKNLFKKVKDPVSEQKFNSLVSNKTPAENPAWLNLFLTVAQQAYQMDQALQNLETINVASLRLAVQDLIQNFPDTYKDGPALLKALDEFEKNLPALKAGMEAGDPQALAALAKFDTLRKQALLGNPLLDFEKVLLIKRNEANLGLPANWQGNSSMNPHTQNEIVTLSLKNLDSQLQTLYKPEKDYYVGDVDLNFDADKMMFSSISTNNRWQVFEVRTDGSGLRQVTKGEEDDVDNYDPMYLPDGRVIFCSTSGFHGVPCVSGSDYVGNLHLMNADGTGMRRLCFDQDNDWYPVMLPNGRVLYLRWEYTDSAHYFSRVLMSMNPDGTGQTEFYGSNSYWPNSLFYARPLPGSSTKFVGIVTGHHGVKRMGEMVVFDASKARQEDSGAIQRIPGYGKPVKGIIKDQLVNDSWPKFLHPFPLNEKYFLAAMKPSEKALWGIYLVDIFDNLLLLKELPGFALMEPMPLRKTERPPVMVDKVKLDEKYASVYIHNIYLGEGLKGVPKGSVQSLRVFQYEYSYRNMGGHYVVGMEGPWDVRRIIGTVPVKDDGSAMFYIPANTPVSVQPLDAEGQALQQFRSWFVGMPGEFVSCVGCHEKQNQSSSLNIASAAKTQPVQPTPWRGPKRGFSFARDVQMVLDKYCVGCHDGQADRASRPNFADTNIITTSRGIVKLPKSYTELHPYVRRNGPEGDYHTLTPLEFHVDTSLLVQMLRKGHHNVKLDDEAWDRLITWIDLNVPCYGTFHEVATIPKNFEQRRYESKKKYACVDEDIEAIPASPAPRPQFVKPSPESPRPAAVNVVGWPISTDKAQQMQASLSQVDSDLDLGGGVKMKLKHIPAGEFAMGDVNGDANEYPMTQVKIDQPYYLGATEVTLQQYQQYDPVHKNGYYDMHYKDQVRPGYLMDDPQKPAIRVSWDQAIGFCQWLSARTGRKVSLPTEAQWEWACRAGAGTPFFYGDLNTDFSGSANLADASISELAVSGVDPKPVKNPDKFWDFVPKDGRFNDGVLHLAEAGRYKANAWGLHDMIGNVGEWTLDTCRPYPYSPKLAQNDANIFSHKVVRGGSWSERPKESRASSRLEYPSWQRVYNVGFRVVVLN
jgi:formylglycine-generating enzyme required for sulfatase activity